MNRTVRHIGLIVTAIAGFTWSCVPTTATQTTSTVVNYSHNDDASKYRPQVEVVNAPEVNETVIENRAIESRYSIDDQMQSIVDSMYFRNDTIRLWDGYTILVYSGNNELEAGRVRNRLFDMVPDQEAKFSYKLPTYFVKVGQYFQKVEALPLLKDIQRTYPSAAIVPEKFPIEKNDTGEN